MDALAEVRNEESRLQDAGLLWASLVLVARSSIACPTAPVPPTSPPVAPSATRGVSIDLYCDHCGQDRHVEAFSYRKKKARKRVPHVLY
jgi:hypothetical protein